MHDESCRPFVCRGYGRASTDAQVISTEQQEAIALDAFHAYTRIKPNWKHATWGGFFGDGGEHHVSRDTKLRERHFGGLILAASQPGDFIIAANFDRIFANVIDVCETLEYCRQRNIGIVVLDMDIDTSTILGETVFTILAAVKRMEVKEIRRRNKENVAYRKRIGRPHCNSLMGWEIATVTVPGVHGRQRFFVPDHAARRLAREILHVKVSNGMNYETAMYHCNRIGLKQRNGRRWTIRTFWKWCRAAEDDFVLPNGSHEAAPIPANAEPVAVTTISAAGD